eukprot:1245291-Rhodomonas_salina.2
MKGGMPGLLMYDVTLTRALAPGLLPPPRPSVTCSVICNARHWPSFLVQCEAVLADLLLAGYNARYRRSLAASYAKLGRDLEHQLSHISPGGIGCLALAKYLRQTARPTRSVRTAPY